MPDINSPISTVTSVTLGEWKAERVNIKNKISEYGRTENDTPCTFADLVNLCITQVYEIAVELGASNPFDAALDGIKIIDGKKCVTYQELKRTDTLVVRIQGLGGESDMHQYKFSGQTRQFPRLVVDSGTQHIDDGYTFNSIVALDSVTFEPISKDIKIRFENITVAPNIYLINGDVNAGYCDEVELLPRYEDINDPHDVWIRMKNGIRVKLKIDLAVNPSSGTLIYRGSDTTYYNGSLDAYNSEYSANIHGQYSNYDTTVKIDNNNDILGPMKTTGVEVDVVPYNGQGNVKFVGVMNSTTSVYVVTDGHIIIRNLSNLNPDEQNPSYEEAKSMGSSVVYPPVRNGSTETNVNKPSEIELAVISQSDNMYDRYIWRCYRANDDPSDEDWSSIRYFDDPNYQFDYLLHYSELNVSETYIFEFKAIAVFKPKTITISEYMKLKLLYKNGEGADDFVEIEDVEKTETQWKHIFQTQEIINPGSTTSEIDNNQYITLRIVGEHGTMDEEYWDAYQIVDGAPVEYAAMRISMNNGINGVASPVQVLPSQIYVSELTYKHNTILPYRLNLYLRPVRKITLTIKMYPDSSIEIHNQTIPYDSSHPIIETFIDSEQLSEKKIQFKVIRTANTFNSVDPKVLYGKNALINGNTNYQNLRIDKNPAKLEPTDTSCSITIYDINVLQTYISIDLKLKLTKTLNIILNMPYVINHRTYDKFQLGIGTGLYLGITKTADSWEQGTVRGGVSYTSDQFTSGPRTYNPTDTQGYTGSYTYSFEVDSDEIMFMPQMLARGNAVDEYYSSCVINKLKYSDSQDGTFSPKSGYATEANIADTNFNLSSPAPFVIVPTAGREIINVKLDAIKYPPIRVKMSVLKIPQMNHYPPDPNTKYGMNLNLWSVDSQGQYGPIPVTGTDVGDYRNFEFIAPDYWQYTGWFRRFAFTLVGDDMASDDSEIVGASLTAFWGDAETGTQLFNYNYNVGNLFDSNSTQYYNGGHGKLCYIDNPSAEYQETFIGVVPIEGDPKMKVVYVDVWTGVPGGGNQGNGWDRYTRETLTGAVKICPTSETSQGCINVYIDCKDYATDRPTIVCSGELIYTSGNKPLSYTCQENTQGDDASHVVAINYNCADFYSFNVNNPSHQIWTNEMGMFTIEYKIGTETKGSPFTFQFIVDTVGRISLETTDLTNARPEAGGYFKLSCKASIYEKEGSNIVLKEYYSDSSYVDYSLTADPTSALSSLAPVVQTNDILTYTFASDPGLDSIVFTATAGLHGCAWYTPETVSVSVAKYMTLVHQYYYDGYVETSESTNRIITKPIAANKSSAIFCIYCREVPPVLSTYIRVKGRLIDLNLVNATLEHSTNPDYNVIVKVEVKKDFYTYNETADRSDRVVYDEDVHFTIEYLDYVGSELTVLQTLTTNTKAGPVMKMFINGDGDTINKAVGSLWNFQAYISTWKSNKTGTETKNPGEIFDTAVFQNLTNGSAVSIYLNTVLVNPSDHRFRTTVTTEFTESTTINTNLICPAYPMYNTSTLKTTVVGFTKYINIWSNNVSDRNKDIVLCAAPSGRGGAFYTYNSSSIPQDAKFKLDDYNNIGGVYYATFKVGQDATGQTCLYRIRKNSTTETRMPFICGWDYNMRRPKDWTGSYTILRGTNFYDYLGMQNSCYTSCSVDSIGSNYNKLTAYFTTYTYETLSDVALQNLETHPRCQFYMQGQKGGTYYTFKSKPFSYDNPSQGQIPKCRNNVNWGLTSDIYSSNLDDKPIWEMTADEITAKDQWVPFN